MIYVPRPYWMQHSHLQYSNRKAALIVLVWPGKLIWSLEKGVWMVRHMKVIKKKLRTELLGVE